MQTVMKSVLTIQNALHLLKSIQKAVKREGQPYWIFACIHSDLKVLGGPSLLNRRPKLESVALSMDHFFNEARNVRYLDSYLMILCLNEIPAYY